MEGILIDYGVLGAGVFMSALVLLVLVFGGVLLARLAEEERTGKRFFWAEWPLPESESHEPAELDAMRAA
ncbi:MAG TPA: hypothetical protein VF827_10910 [Syntrophales bacterium]